MTLAGYVGRNSAAYSAVTAVETRYNAVVAMPFGGLRLGIRLTDDALTAIDFLNATPPDGRVATPATDDLARRVTRQLHAYFEDPAARFRLPVAPAGTPFQRRVWQTLTAIPPGTVLSYGELARSLGSSPRAVGGACRANPVPVVIPCHRVVAARGPGGYGGATAGTGMRIKRWLLAHEGCVDVEGGHADGG